LHQLAVTPFLDASLNDPRNRSNIPRQLEACGYEKVHNPNMKAGGFWKIDGEYHPVYGLATAPLAARMAAAQLLVKPRLV
jgi:hypothetical protein